MKLERLRSVSGHVLHAHCACIYIYVCVCVFERKRERERGKKREHIAFVGACAKYILVMRYLEMVMKSV